MLGFNLHSGFTSPINIDRELYKSISELAVVKIKIPHFSIRVTTRIYNYPIDLTRGANEFSLSAS